MKTPPRGVDDGIPPLGPRQSLCCRKGARREVSLRLSRMNCNRQFIPTTTASGCRGFESRHANDKKPRTLTGTGLFVQGWTMGFPLWGRGRAFAVAKVPAGKCPCGSAGRIATGNPPPLQPAVVVASNPATLMK